MNAMSWTVSALVATALTAAPTAVSAKHHGRHDRDDTAAIITEAGAL